MKLDSRIEKRCLKVISMLSLFCVVVVILSDLLKCYSHRSWCEHPNTDSFMAMRPVRSVFKTSTHMPKDQGSVNDLNKVRRSERIKTKAKTKDPILCTV